MEFVNKIRSRLDSNWLPEIYRREVRSLRTRSFKMDVPQRENTPVIADTLLGKEIKVSGKRIYCPDEPMARYLSIFARLGCRDMAVPYDITTIETYAELLEQAWQKTVAEINAETAGMSPQVRGRYRAAVIRVIREEIARIGAGEAMPLFDSSTRQRNS